MNTLKTKIFLLGIMFLTFMFFSNDFGLINIEKSAIVTALAIDLDDNNSSYIVTAQIAVPEVSNTTAENPKAIIEGKGFTVQEAINDIGNISGWYLKLAFCNLVICGNSLTSSNVLKEVDYFARTLNIQDSATIILAENKASELLKVASPFDNISSFALQKILLKDPGFDNDVTVVDVRDFVKGCFDRNKSAFMPLVKIIKQKASDKENSGGGEQNSSSTSNENKGDDLFDATTTALFKDGILVGKLPEELTMAYNLLKKNSSATSLNVPIANGERVDNYLLSFIKIKPSVKLYADENNLELNITLNVYAKIIDDNVDYSNATFTKNTPLPDEVIKETQKILTERLQGLVDTLKQTKCDFLDVDNMLYRFNYSHYPRYKDNYFEKLKLNTKVTVTGQK